VKGARAVNTKQATHDHWVTLSGRRIDKVVASPKLQKRIAELSGWFWNALLNWDSHTVSEVVAAHEQFDYDPFAVVEDDEQAEQSRAALASIEWDDFLRMAIKIVDNEPAAAKEWRGWLAHELASVVGLRLIDHAVRFLERDQVQDAAILLMDATEAYSYVWDLGKASRRNVGDPHVATERYIAKRIKDSEDKGARQATAKAGANARHKNTRALKQFALDLAARKSYRSKRQAAQAITPEVMAEAKKLKCPLSQDRAEKTIYGWLLESQ
jgi:hypothetical protein